MMNKSKQLNCVRVVSYDRSCCSENSAENIYSKKYIFKKKQQKLRTAFKKSTQL